MSLEGSSADHYTTAAYTTGSVGVYKGLLLTTGGRKVINHTIKETLMYKKMLISTDGSENAAVAEEHGLALAQQLGASVTVLHVVEVIHSSRSISSPTSLMLDEQKDLLMAEGKKIVEKVVEKGKKMGVRVDPVVAEGHPANEIIEHAQDFDIVVVGTLGKSGFSHLMMGSVAEKVVRHSPVPVLVVKSQRSP